LISQRLEVRPNDRDHDVEDGRHDDEERREDELVMEAMGNDAEENGEEERDDPLEYGRSRPKESEVGLMVEKNAFAFDPTGYFETGPSGEG
jgi:hypothetical protein